ncbi:MAG: hypothetical protein CM1200mP14_18820 [Gammaproteobacteria bacterium]|nr:MAG: hypothetical protein CM1200mP14_18820 [Gammaproteobacteria bacterium]
MLLGRVAQRFGKIQNETDQDLLSSLVSRHYLGGGDEGMVDLPRMVLSPNSFSDQDLLEEILTEAAGYRVRITVPQRGEKLRLSELAEVNARRVWKIGKFALLADIGRNALFSLQDELSKKFFPRLMVCLMFHICRVRKRWRVLLFSRTGNRACGLSPQSGSRAIGEMTTFSLCRKQFTVFPKATR